MLGRRDEFTPLKIPPMPQTSVIGFQAASTKHDGLEFAAGEVLVGALVFTC